MTVGEAVAIATVILGTGGLVAVGNYLIARRKVPVEVDSVAVQGAESAVLAMEKANQALERRALSAEAERDRLLTRVQTLEGQLEVAQGLLEQMRTEISAIRRGVATA